ncbi:DUF1642 domain-containing protein [Lactococcus garvieae]|uniref:DUF1642 domain-containing protein n=1 Tax=Lactococcus garvieae TaxID=1363 RepID=UPI00254B0FCB|nr:DUF1642 domain-containing protein [Lactococcus garvieae]
MKKFEEEFNYLIELSGKVLTGQIEAEKFETHRAIFLNEYGKKQHPEIPEVPQFVADWLDKKPLYTINSFIPVEIIGWSKKQTGYADLGMNINHLLKLKVNGYTVAKEKRFYLKNKLTGDCLARCLSRASSGLYVEVTEKWLTRKEQTSYQLSFTQQEIDSMETGSYEQIEVEE